MSRQQNSVYIYEIPNKSFENVSKFKCVAMKLRTYDLELSL